MTLVLSIIAWYHGEKGGTAMKTLYVSDLDGTLLRSDGRTSGFTNETINRLVEAGLIFSYATARSYHTARKVTRGLNAAFPLIVYNGAMVVDNRDGSFLLKNFFGPEVLQVLEELFRNDIFPIVYSFLEGEEKFSYIPHRVSRGQQRFLDTRRGDQRERPVATTEELKAGEIFYLTCIDEPERLIPLYEKYREIYHCVFQKDIYTGDHWLEIMPKAASKAHAIRQLKEKLGCDRVVVFGDGKNDLDMFCMAQESYAVANAVAELKAVATGVIGGNDADAVANWLLNNGKI